MAGVLSLLGAAPPTASTVAVIVAGAFMIAAALAATAAFGPEELGTGLLLLIGAVAVVAARLRARERGSDR